MKPLRSRVAQLAGGVIACAALVTVHRAFMMSIQSNHEAVSQLAVEAEMEDFGVGEVGYDAEQADKLLKSLTQKPVRAFADATVHCVFLHCFISPLL